MVKKRTWFLGIGCLVVVVGVALVLLVMIVGQPRLPRNVVISVRLDGPIVEIAPKDPLAELVGERSLSLRDLRTALVRAADDERVRGVRLRIDTVGGGFATVQEIRSLLGRVRAAGKWTAAYMDTAGEFAPGNHEYYVASACDEVSLNELGDVNLIGLSVRTPFFLGTLKKLGVRAEFPGRGDYKTARFMYTQDSMTPAHEEMMRWLVDSLMEQMTEDIASSRGREVEEIRHLIDTAPFFGEEAVKAGLVDRLEDWGGFCERLKEHPGGSGEVVSLSDYLIRSAGSELGPKIAVVTAVGGIMRGESRKSFNPILGEEIMGAETIAQAWRDVRRAKGIKAAVFRIDSGGGSAVASEIIRQEMARTAEKIPVVVSMSNVAGSGGYWITCGAKRVVAYPATITASIGVYAGHLNMEELYSDRLGITHGRLDYGSNAALYGTLDNWAPEQEAVIERLLDRIYDSFVERVSSSRGMSEEEVRAIGDGRVFTGAQSLDNGLVDVLGSFDTALDEAKKLAGYDPTQRVRLVDFPKAVPWWRQALESRHHEEIALSELRRTIEESLATGTIKLPGAVWMPPIDIR
jgi:protease-4